MSSADDSFTLSLEEDSEPQDAETPTLSGSTPIPDNGAEIQAAEEPAASQATHSAELVTGSAAKISNEASTAVRELAKAMDESGPDELSSDTLARAFGKEKKENGDGTPGNEVTSTSAPGSLSSPNEGNASDSGQIARGSRIGYIAKAFKEK